MQKVRKAYRFYGRVQGVGFRYHVEYNARNLGMTGWVRNCDDGTVEAELQGPEQGHRLMLQALNQARYIRIDDIECHVCPVDEEERSFHVRY